MSDYIKYVAKIEFTFKDKATEKNQNYINVMH